MINELLIMAICAAVVCLLLGLRSLIFRANTKPHSYQVWIMTFGDDDPGNDPSTLEDWSSEIEVPADFFMDTKVKSAGAATLVGGRAVLN